MFVQILRVTFYKNNLNLSIIWFTYKLYINLVLNGHLVAIMVYKKCVEECVVLFLYGILFVF
jgi:hypothetical protein